jgi:hypothetical protein
VISIWILDSGKKKLHFIPHWTADSEVKVVKYFKNSSIESCGYCSWELESGLFIEWVFARVCACGWFFVTYMQKKKKRTGAMQNASKALRAHIPHCNSQSTPHPCYLTQHNSCQNFLLQTCLKNWWAIWLLQVDHWIIVPKSILLASPRCNNWHMKSFHNIILVTKWRRSLRIRRREDLHLWVCGVLKVSGSQF